MKIYPKYDVVEVRETANNRITVTVQAGTTCGPKIQAHSAEVIKDTNPNTVRKAAEEAERVAVRSLGSMYNAVVKTCIKNNTHQGH